MKNTLKKLIAGALLPVLALALLAGCGEKKSEAVNVDLQAFYDEIDAAHDLGLQPVPEDMLDTYYPGLKDIKTTQRVAYMPMISAVVSEFVFVRCADKADAQKVAEILQKRVDDQAAGGAWYPDSVEGWSKAKVITKDDYVLMIASPDYAADIEAAFNEKFGA